MRIVSERYESNAIYPVAQVSGELDFENSISPANYIKWVQRSLNRIFNRRLLTDGRITSKYAALVRRFNRDRLGRNYGDVDMVMQNALIRANEKDLPYMFWVQEVLLRTGASQDLVPTGIKDRVTKRYIKGFQAYHGLKDDGFVGAKTELALIKAGKRLPPGHIKSKVKPSKPKKPFFSSGPVEYKFPSYMSKAARAWVSERPKTVEVKRFKGKRRHWGDVVVWKNNSGFDHYIERPTDLNYIRDKLPKSQRSSAEIKQWVHQMYNKDMSYYVETLKLSPTSAQKRFSDKWGDVLYDMVSGLTTQ